MTDAHHITTDKPGGVALPSSRGECPRGACGYTSCRMNLGASSAANQHGPSRRPRILADDARETCALRAIERDLSVVDVSRLVRRDVRSVHRALARVDAAIATRRAALPGECTDAGICAVLPHLSPLDERVARLRLGIDEDADSYQPRTAAEGTT